MLGVPDKRLGQEICACIILEENASVSTEQLLAHFADTYTTDEGLGVTPAYFLFFNSFPTLNGKVDKKSLTKMAIEMLKLN